MQNIDMCLLYKSHQIARLVSHLINPFSKWMFTVQRKNAIKFGSKMEFTHIFIPSFVNLQRAKDGTHTFDANYRYVFVV